MERMPTAHMPRIDALDNPQPFEILVLQQEAFFVHRGCLEERFRLLLLVLEGGAAGLHSFSPLTMIGSNFVQRGLLECTQ